MTINPMQPADLPLAPDLPLKKTRKRIFLEQMDTVVPWAELVALIAPYYPEGRTGRPPFPLETMLRVHFMQQWFALSDPAMEEALWDTPLFRQFAQLYEAVRLPDESTILRFRHRLEKHKLAQEMFKTVNALLEQRGLILRSGTLVDATLIAAPSSTKNKDKARDPEMHQTKKGNQWYHGMKAHTGTDAHFGLVHTLRCTAANVHDVVEANNLLHGDETDVFADAGYQGADERPDAAQGKRWHIAMKRGKRKALDQSKPRGQLLEQLEQVKSRIRAKVEHPYRVLKCQFGYVKVRYRGLMKNAQQLHTLFALGNLWTVRRLLLEESLGSLA